MECGGSTKTSPYGEKGGEDGNSQTTSKPVRELVALASMLRYSVSQEITRVEASSRSRTFWDSPALLKEEPFPNLLGTCQNPVVSKGPVGLEFTLLGYRQEPVMNQSYVGQFEVPVEETNVLRNKQVTL